METGSWKERTISDAWSRDMPGLSEVRDVVTRQDKSAVAAVPIEMKRFNAVELAKVQAVMSNVFEKSPDLASIVRAKPTVSWKERVISDAWSRDMPGLSKVRDGVASKHVSAIAAVLMATKGLDAVELELVLEHAKKKALLSKLFVNTPDPAPIAQAKLRVSWKERMISEARSRDRPGLSRANAVVAW
jgi:hypothetical protein